MIELLATLAGLAFCFGVGLLFEVNHQAATQRRVEGALAAWRTRMAWSMPTVTVGYQCPDMPTSVAERNAAREILGLD